MRCSDFSGLGGYRHGETRGRGEVIQSGLGWVCFAFLSVANNVQKNPRLSRHLKSCRFLSKAFGVWVSQMQSAGAE